MKLAYKVGEIPDSQELGKLFAQTTWATKRGNNEIRRMLENTDLVLTVRSKGELVGFGRAITDGTYRALVEDIVVKDSFRKKGIGKGIMTELLKHLESVEKVYLHTSPPLCNFYSSLGFEENSGLTMYRKVEPVAGTDPAR